MRIVAKITLYHRAMPALSLATSAPVPMAIPTYSAAASFHFAFR